MKNKKFLRFTAILMTACTILLCACGEKDAGEPPAESAEGASAGNAPENTAETSADGTSKESADVKQDDGSVADRIPEDGSLVEADTKNATPQRFGGDSRGVNVQVLVFGENDGWGWSQSDRIDGDAAMELRMEFGFDNSEEEAAASGFPQAFIPDGTPISSFLCTVNPEDECTDSYTVTITDAGIETFEGKVIELPSLNGCYRNLTGSNEVSQAWADEFEQMVVEEVRSKGTEKSFFRATILVEFSDKKALNLGLSEDSIEAGTYFLDGNTLTLWDFQYNGTLTADEPLQLIIKGDCAVDGLVLHADTQVSRWAYGSLTCNHLEGAEQITFDTTCNSTCLSETDGSYAIVFDERHISTTGDRDEAKGIYDFEWRNSNAKWQQDCRAAITEVRMQPVSLSVTDSQGVPLTDAAVSLKLANYNYKFSAGLGANIFLDLETGGLPQWLYSTSLKLSGNYGVTYSSFLWENFDNTSSEYSFAYSADGNAAFLNDSMEIGKQIGIEVALQPLVYPSFEKIQSNENMELYNRLAEYVLSPDFDGEEFNEIIKAHITEAVMAYAENVNCYAVVNEPYYWTDFLQLVAGGITVEQIAAWTAKASTTEAKINALLKQIKQMERPDAALWASVINDWAHTAEEAWVSAGKNPEDLILYVNDCCCMYDDSEYEQGHYAYFYEIINELAKLPDNRITMVGLQMAGSSDHKCAPTHLIDMLDAFEALGMKVIVTEFNYRIDHVEWTPLGGNCYHTYGCSSRAEEELMYDYAYGMLLASYAHNASYGFVSTGYPSGQAGLYYSCYSNDISPMGEAYSDLVDKIWYVHRDCSLSENGMFDAGTLPLGTYILTIDTGTDRYFAELCIDGSRTEYTIRLQP